MSPHTGHLVLPSAVLRFWLCVLALPLIAAPVSPAAAADDTTEDPMMEVARLRERAIVLARLVREKLPAGSPALVQAELLYADARSLTNLWLDGLKTSLASGENPEDSRVYQPRLERAQTATHAFLQHAEKIMLPPEAQSKFFPGADKVLLSVGRFLWDRFSAAQKARAQEREAARQALLAEIENQKWPAFAAP